MKKTKIIVLLSLISILLVAALGVRFCHNNQIFAAVDSSLKKITQFKTQSNSKIFDSSNQEISELFDRYQIHTPIQEIPKKIIDTLLAVEDKNFFEHPGYDIKAITRVGFSFLRHGKATHGASTITQQLVRKFCLTRRKVLARKLREIYLSFKLEQQISKNKILELYLNNMFFGDGSYGVAAASKRFFNKSLKQLGTHEISLLIGLLQSPSRYNPKKYLKAAKSRQWKVLQAMARSGLINAKRTKEIYNQKLAFKKFNHRDKVFAPYFVDYVGAKLKTILGDKYDPNQGIKVYTTLSRRSQTIVEKTIATHVKRIKEVEKMNQRFLPKKSRLDLETSFLVTNPQTGEILAMQGGNQYQKSQFNRVWQAKRSPGSLIKPAVYLSALESGMHWYDSMYISPLRYEQYRPKNSTSSFMTESTLLRSFYLSLNTPVVEITKKLGLGKVLKRFKSLGIKSPVKRELGSALGGSEVTMLDMARMYSSIANLGMRKNIFAIRMITNMQGDIIYQHQPTNSKVIEEDYAHMIIDGMRKVMTFGTAKKASGYSKYYVGKTGTSNNGVDNWFCGFSPNLMAMAWVGSDNYLPLQVKFGGHKLALPIWMDFIQANKTSQKPDTYVLPEHFTSIKINPKHGYISENGIEVAFLKGTEPTLEKRDSTLGSISQKGDYRGIFQ